MTQPMPTPSTDSGTQIDAAIRQYLHSPQVTQGLRATLRHAIIAACFEHGRAVKFDRLTELLRGVPPQESFEDESALVNELSRFVAQKSQSSVVTDESIRQMVADEVSRQMSELKIVRATQ